MKIRIEPYLDMKIRSKDVINQFTVISFFIRQTSKLLDSEMGTFKSDRAKLNML